MVAARAGRAIAPDVAEWLETAPGVSAPFPNVFDPLNIAATARDVAEMKRWREAEITHGRVSMLAALGFVVGEQLEDFRGFLNFDGNISGVPAIYQFQKVEETRPLFWETLVIVIGLAESYRVSAGWASPKSADFNKLIADYTPGDLGFDPLGLCPTDEAELYELKTKELNNGRLAMISIAGFVAQELVVNREIFEHLLLYLEDDVIADVIDPIEKDLIKGGVDVGLTPLAPIPPAGVSAGL